MQDLLLAQKRDRPAYYFQHLTLELRSHDNGYRANLAAASATLAP
jgi:spore coat polysaccharide biosynthesis protein SpsF (cytidylyltransferase family)